MPIDYGTGPHAFYDPRRCHGDPGALDGRCDSAFPLLCALLPSLGHPRAAAATCPTDPTEQALPAWSGQAA